MTDDGVIVGELTAGGRARTFTLRPPSRLSSGGTTVVLALHGNMPDAGGAEMCAMTTFDKQAEARGWVVAYPDGVGGCWADGRGVTTADEAGVDDVAFLRALIDWAAERYGAFPDRAVVAGMSNGAFMAHRMGVSASDQVAVIAAVSGGLAERVRDDLPAPAHAVSALLIHGTADEISPLEGGYSRHRGPNGELRGRTLSLDESALFWRNIDQCPDEPGDKKDTELSSRLTWAGRRSGTRVSAWTVFGGGHLWPGSEPWPGFEHLATREFDAAEEICRFAQPLATPAVARRLSGSA